MSEQLDRPPDLEMAADPGMQPRGDRTGPSRMAQPTDDRPPGVETTRERRVRWGTTKPLHPSLIRHAEERAASIQNRIADLITAFAGSMWFVYIHTAWFILWVIYRPFNDNFPFGLLTMIVSLEAIFLSTFVMISQNRADEKRQALADHQWELVQIEEKQNEQLLAITERLLKLTTEAHSLTTEVHQVVKG